MESEIKTAYPGDKLLRIMSKHAVNRNNGVARLFSGLIPCEKKPHVLEFGAGLGEFADRVASLPGVTLTVIESDSAYREQLAQRFIVFERIEEVPGIFDFVYLVDVLEHVENDEELLKKFFQKLAPGGMLFIYVPARPELYSGFDRDIGHYRRYNKRELMSKTAAAGFQIQKCSYHELLGYFAVWLNKLMPGDKVPGERSVKFYDKLVVPLTNKVENLLGAPVGKSLYLVATKPQ